MDMHRLQIELPKMTSLLFAGSALYVGFIDPYVRSGHQKKKSQLDHWHGMYNNSKIPMSVIAVTSSVLGLNAYLKTKEIFWLYGSLAIFSVLPFTFAAIMKINNQLGQYHAKGSIKASQEETITERLKSWVTRHRVRAFLSLLAVGLFYVAQSKHLTKQFLNKTS